MPSASPRRPRSAPGRVSTSPVVYHSARTNFSPSPKRSRSAPRSAPSRPSSSASPRRANRIPNEQVTAAVYKRMTPSQQLRFRRTVRASQWPTNKRASFALILAVCLSLVAPAAAVEPVSTAMIVAWLMSIGWWGMVMRVLNSLAGLFNQLILLGVNQYTIAGALLTVFVKSILDHLTVREQRKIIREMIAAGERGANPYVLPPVAQQPIALPAPAPTPLLAAAAHTNAPRARVQARGLWQRFWRRASPPRAEQPARSPAARRGSPGHYGNTGGMFN